MTDASEKFPDRTRPHPDERFAPSARVFDFGTVAADMVGEASVTTKGHRQETLYRHGNSVLALFLFDAGSELREHRANGTVFIQILQGRMAVRAAGERHELSAGQVLAMAPGVPHDLQALEASRMLLTVCLQPTSAEVKP